jgi:hypothetical protein
MATLVAQAFTRIGGMRWQKRNATWPLAILTIDEAGVDLRPRWSLGRRLRFLCFPQEVQVRWGEIDRVDLVRGVAGSYGLRMRVHGEPLIFWCRRSELGPLIAEFKVHVPDKVEAQKKPSRYL